MTELRWRKSTHSSGDTQGECVEVGFGAGAPVGVRDTKAREAGKIDVPGESWRALLAAVRPE